MQSITLRTVQQEARADSRELARSLGNKHENVMSLISDYADVFEGHGILRFETEEITGRGRPGKFALLNEDQCYFLLTLVRNSDQTVPLKSELVRAFGEARRASVQPAPLTPAQQLLLQAQMLVAQEARVEALERRLDNTPISQFPEQEGEIQALCQELGKVMPGSFPAAYRAFKARFGYGGVPLARYKACPPAASRRPAGICAV